MDVVDRLGILFSLWILEMTAEVASSEVATDPTEVERTEEVDGAVDVDGPVEENDLSSPAATSVDTAAMNSLRTQASLSSSERLWHALHSPSWSRIQIRTQ